MLGSSCSIFPNADVAFLKHFKNDYKLIFNYLTIIGILFLITLAMAMERLN
jgi:hypothetical protein